MVKNKPLTDSDVSSHCHAMPGFQYETSHPEVFLTSSVGLVNLYFGLNLRLWDPGMVWAGSGCSSQEEGVVGDSGCSAVCQGVPQHGW